jgi:hypothetical protein
MAAGYEYVYLGVNTYAVCEPATSRPLASHIGSAIGARSAVVPMGMDFGDQSSQRGEHIDGGSTGGRQCRWSGRQPQARAEHYDKGCTATSTGSVYPSLARPVGMRYRFSSSALLTTLTLDIAIAAPANTGDRKPSAASGMPTTL